MSATVHVFSGSHARHLGDGGAFHRVCHAVAVNLIHIDMRKLCCDHTVHDAAFADDLCEGTCIDAAKADDASFFKKGVKITLRTEIGGRLTPFFYDITTGTDDLSLKIGGDHAVIADERKCLDDNLPK